MIKDMFTETARVAGDITNDILDDVFPETGTTSASKQPDESKLLDFRQLVLDHSGTILDPDTISFLDSFGDPRATP